MKLANKHHSDSIMIALFLLIWSVFLWGLHSSFIAKALSAEEPTTVAGIPVNILYIVIVTFALVLLPYLFTRHINFDDIESPETKRKFKWGDD